jgi:hypothetical protein
MISRHFRVCAEMTASLQLLTKTLSERNRIFSKNPISLESGSVAGKGLGFGSAFQRVGETDHGVMGDWAGVQKYNFCTPE